MCRDLALTRCWHGKLLLRTLRSRFRGDVRGLQSVSLFQLEEIKIARSRVNGKVATFKTRLREVQREFFTTKSN